MIEFQNIEALYLLVIIIPFIFILQNSLNNSYSLKTIFSPTILKRVQLSNNGLSQKTRSILFILSFIFTIVAISRPIINNGEIKIKSSFINMVIALDISRSMNATDTYPTRFDFAKKKFIDILPHFKNTKVSLIGFSTQTFLISPLTQDFHSLKFLVNNLDTNNITLKGTDILNTLESANELMQNQKKKILFLLTDGSSNDDFSKEIKYAKENSITVYIYNIGTIKGGTIPTANGILKDNKNGNIVIVKRNDNIKAIALQTNGAFMSQTLDNDDIKLIAKDIQTKFTPKEEKDKTIKDSNELFYIPLGIAILLFFISMFSIPAKKYR